MLASANSSGVAHADHHGADAVEHQPRQPCDLVYGQAVSAHRSRALRRLDGIEFELFASVAAVPGSGWRRVRRARPGSTRACAAAVAVHWPRTRIRYAALPMRRSIAARWSAFRRSRPSSASRRRAISLQATLGRQPDEAPTGRAATERQAARRHCASRRCSCALTGAPAEIARIRSRGRRPDGEARSPLSRSRAGSRARHPPRSTSRSRRSERRADVRIASRRVGKRSSLA